MDGHFFPCRKWLLPLAGLSLIAAPVMAGDDSWTVAGQPSGGTVKRVVVNPTTPGTLYALAGPGVFESTDSGADWTLVYPHYFGTTTDVAIDPLSPNVLYVSTLFDGVQKSTDGGATWAAASSGIDHVTGLDDYVSVMQVVVDPVNEGVVYAMTQQDGVFKSSDGGTTWNAIDTGLESALASGSVPYFEALTLDPQNTQNLYLGTIVTTATDNFYGDDPDSGLYRSTDGGAHWTVMVGKLVFTNVTVDPSNDQNVYAGGSDLYVSSDGGASFTKTASSVKGVVAVDPANSKHLWGTNLIFASTYGIYESTDQGTTWNPVSAGNANVATSLARDPATPANLYLSTADFGLYKSTDGGATWAESDAGIFGIQGQVLHADEHGELYLASQGTGVLKSGDHGASWTMASDGMLVAGSEQGPFVTSLVEDTASPGTFYAGTENGLFKTTDSAASWTQLTSGLTDNGIQAVAIDPENEQNLYVGADLHGVFKSTDGGNSWNNASSGITGAQVWTLAVSPTDSNTVFAGTSQNGVFVTHDGANTWQPVDVAGIITNVETVAIAPSDSNTILVSLAAKGIYKSTDGGTTWSSANDGLVTFSNIGVIQFDEHAPGKVYALTMDGSAVFLSTDAGSTWHALGIPIAIASAQASLAMRPHSVRTTWFASGRRLLSTSSAVSVAMSAITVDPNTGQIYGTGSDGRVYTYTYVPSGSTGGTTGSGSTGGSGGTSGGSNTGNGGGTTTNGGVTGGGTNGGGTHSAGAGQSGGGAFWFLSDLLLLGAWFARRRGLKR